VEISSDELHAMRPG
jgi:hypothetical protein